MDVKEQWDITEDHVIDLKEELLITQELISELSKEVAADKL